MAFGDEFYMSETLYPIMLLGKGMHAIVVGGGDIALAKTEGLLLGGLTITVISPELNCGLSNLAKDGKICWIQRAYQSPDLDDADLIFGCTNDNAVNTQVSKDAQARRKWVNIVDVNDLCTFYMPSVLRRGGFVLAVSTTGASPALARKVRLFLEETFGEEWETFIDLMAALRPELKDTITDMDARREFVERIWNSAALQLIRDGNTDGAKELIRKCMSSSSA